MKKYIIYHDKCPDGLTSAALFMIHTIKYNYDDSHNYEFIGGNYNMTLEDLNLKPNSIVYFLDFSFKFDLFSKILEEAHSVFLLDHHKTAYDELHSLFNHTKLKVYFDKNECGASLTYKYLYPDKPLPIVIEHIRDQDLWLWKDPNSKFYCSFLNTVEPTLEGYYNYFKFYFAFPDKDSIYKNALFVGEKLLQFNERRALNCIEANLRKFDFDQFKDVCIINCPSDLTGYISTKLIDTGSETVLITYTIGPKGLRVSIRSKDEVSISIAKLIDPIKAGGHPKASGAFIPFEQFSSHWFTKLIFSL